MKWVYPLALLAISGIAHAENSTLSTDVAFLASPDLDGRSAGTDGDTKARTYITKRMKDAGLTTIEQGFEFDKTKTANVIGYITGETDDIIVIGAHYDHLGDGHLGANDNASGVAAMLAIADVIKAKGEKPHRTIAFAAWGAEEEGTIGSTFYVAHPPTELPLDKVVQYINLDMVGSYSSKRFVAAMGSFPKLPARTLLDKLVKSYPKTRVGLGGRAVRSDHTAFCDQGIPYVFFWTPDESCYHEKCDKPAKIDLKHMADITALAGDLAWGLSESKTDLAAARKTLGCFAKKK